MPIYRYVCGSCGHEEKLFRPASKADDPVYCKRGDPEFKMDRALTIPSVRSLETSDEYHDRKNVQDINKMADERARDHWRKHELPRFIEKNGIQEAIRNGWANPDGTPKI